jgi:maleylacetoacetate isomerase
VSRGAVFVHDVGSSHIKIVLPLVRNGAQTDVTNEPTFQLYGYWGSMATYRVRVALVLKNIPVQEIPINLSTEEQLTPAFLAINPAGAVPALIEPGQAPITQSIAILEYLDERYPEPPLLPKDLRARARVRSLTALIASDTHPLIAPRVRKYLTTRAGLGDAASRAWTSHWLHRGLTAMEARLAGDPSTGIFCHGDQVTIADVCLASLLVIAKLFKFESPTTPTVNHIVARCEELEAFARANPKDQAGAHG